MVASGVGSIISTGSASLAAAQASGRIALLSLSRSPQKLGLPNKNYSFFSGYENFLESAIFGWPMQYLSQRLAQQPASERDAASPRPILAGGQRERLLDATEALIAERGAAKTSIEAIVKRAGVSSVTFYEHFRDKDECFVAAFDRAAGELRAIAMETIPEGASWDVRVEAVLGGLLDVLDAEPARARLCFVEAQKDGPRMRVRYEEALDAIGAELGDPLAQAIVGGLAWLLRERLELGGGEGVQELLPQMTEVILSPGRADG
jgi:AcrR family transcriptional regulator